MVTDFAAWIFLIAQMKGYAKERSRWRTIRPVDHLFPDGFVTFGEAGCDRLRLPLPSTLEIDSDTTSSAVAFHFRSLSLLSEMARTVKSGEKLALVLIGHGGVQDDGEFQLLISTKDKIEGEAIITKELLEGALEHCQGDILIICNSCNSGLLASDRWTLLCSAPEGHPSESLMQSGSGYVRGSTFTACVVAQVAYEHGLQVPLARTDPRHGADRDVVPLPSSPPSHSFSTPAALSTIDKPSNISFDKFVQRMLNVEKFFIENDACHKFQLEGAKSIRMASCTSILPINFTPEVVSRIHLKPDSVNCRTGYKALEGPRKSLQGGALPTLGSQTPGFDPLLIKLVNAMPEFYTGPGRTREAIYIKLGASLRRYIAEPGQHTYPLQGVADEENLLLVLRSMHVQAVAVQLLAKELNWCHAADRVEPFLLLRNISSAYGTVDNGGTLDNGGMLNNGIKLNKLPFYLATHHFPG